MVSALTVLQASGRSTLQLLEHERGAWLDFYGSLRNLSKQLKAFNDSLR